MALARSCCHRTISGLSSPLLLGSASASSPHLGVPVILPRAGSSSSSKLATPGRTRRIARPNHSLVAARSSSSSIAARWH